MLKFRKSTYTTAASTLLGMLFIHVGHAATPVMSKQTEAVLIAANKDITARDFGSAQSLLSKSLATAVSAADKTELETAIAVTDRLWSGSLFVTGNDSKALSTVIEATDAAQEAGNVAEQEKTCTIAGFMSEATGDRISAIKYYSAALRTATKVGDQKTRAQEMESIANVLLETGQLIRALTYDVEAQKLAAVTGDFRTESISLSVGAQIERALGHREIALDFFEKSLRIASKSGNTAVEVVDNSGMGGILTDEHKFGAALPDDLLASSQSAKMNDPASEEIDLAYTGKAYEGLGQNDNALEFYQKSAAVARKIGDNDMLAQTLTFEAALYTESSNFQAALANDKECVQLDTKAGNLHNLEMDLNNASSDCTHLKNFDDAADYGQKALAMATKSGDTMREVADLSNMAMICRNLGEPDNASAYDARADALSKLVSPK